jgi:transcriptional regulator with XRE-family HTH domain
VDSHSGTPVPKEVPVVPVAIIDSKKLRAELRALGLTQIEFARRHHLRESTVSQVLHGHPVDPGILYDIARGLAVEKKGAS